MFVNIHALSGLVWLGCGVDVDSYDNDAVGFSLQYLHAGLAGRYVKLLGGSGLLKACLVRMIGP